MLHCLVIRLREREVAVRVSAVKRGSLPCFDDP